MSQGMTSPSSIKRVRFTPDVKDADDVSPSSTSVLLPPKTPRHASVPIGTYGFPPSPQFSDSSSLASDADCFLHQLLLCRQGGFNMIFDVRTKPSKAYIPAPEGALPLTQYFNVPATQPLQRRLILISRHFDWRIVVENPNGVTIGDVLFRIRDSLNKIASKEEYGAVPEDVQAEILKAYQRNCNATSNGSKLRDLKEGLKRVDWLGKRTLLAGIQKDEGYISRRIRNHSERPETYVVEFSPSSR
ncbi:hypothetical protein FRB90_005432 [Tulasnella sp. 427]|nr:hypothetical protein FRB90_005432 [Tulasnella sp. 427]